MRIRIRPLQPLRPGPAFLFLVVSMPLLVLLSPSWLRSADAKRRSEPASTPEKVLILGYHEITERSEALIPEFAVTPTMFVRQMDWLRLHGFHFVTVDDLLADDSGQRALPERAVLVTFDDGYRSVYDHAWPILKAWRIPAVFSVVGQWEEDTGAVDFDGHQIPRDDMLSWTELQEMQASGLVEIGSHSFDLHHGIEGNPQGNLEPAGTTRRWFADRKAYEDEIAYRRRIEADLVRSKDVIRRRIGRAPRVIAWPYGAYNETMRDLAVRHGMVVGLTLDDGANRDDTPLARQRRILVEGDLTLEDFARAIDERERDLSDNRVPQKIVHVDLDYVYDPDPVQENKNLGDLLERLVWLNANAVYLQAYADPDGDGTADAVYFPNRHMPVRADLFNRVAWQIQTRTQVKRIYAWMPVLAWRLPAAEPAANDLVEAAGRKGQDRVDMGYRRLSPFSARARQTVREIYEDLGRTVHFDGVLFHDDVTLSDFEDASAFGRAAYRDWGLPDSIEAIRASDDLIGRWTILKINALDDFAKELAAILRTQQPALVTSRNLYARVVQNPKAEVWYSQSIDNSLASYDFTAIMAMPYMEQAPDPKAFYRELVERVKQHPDGLAKVVFELQSVDWRHDNRPIPSEEMVATIRSLYEMGARHVGYYPDEFLEGRPDATSMRAVFGTRLLDADAP